VEKVLQSQKRHVQEVLPGAGAVRKRPASRAVRKAWRMTLASSVAGPSRLYPESSHEPERADKTWAACLSPTGSASQHQSVLASSITRPRAALIRWLLTTQRPQAGEIGGSVPARGWGALIHYREDHSMPHNFLIGGQC